jgi:chromosomal replication initiator protein
MAIYLCHNLTSLSLAKIGHNFGNRDHSTVLYSCEKLKELMKTNEEIKNDIENIKIKITNL